MKNIQNLLQEYRNSDAEKRLNLFLQHRWLREEFDVIDRTDPAEGVSHRLRPGKISKIRMFYKSLAESRHFCCPGKPVLRND